MVAVAIFSTDPVLRRNLEQLPRDEPAVVIVGIFDQPSSFPEPVNRDCVDVLLADVPTQELLADYRARHGRIALVALLDGADSEDIVRAFSGARAPSSIARPAVMRLSQPSRRLAPGLSSWRRNSLRRCSMRIRLPMICSKRMVPAAPD